MRECKLESLKNIKLSRKSNNIWNKIGLLYFGHQSFNNAFQIYQWWNRNSHNYSNLIENYFNYSKKIVKDQNAQIKTIQINLDQKDIMNIKTFIMKTKRKKFKSDFDTFLSEKLQLCGINCWLKCKYNWFLTKKLYWRGVFICIDSTCSRKFEASILNDFYNIDKKISLIIKYNEDGKYHKIILNNSFRCCGLKRDEQKMEILANGLTNCQTNNVIHNNIRSNERSKENEIKMERKVTNRHTLKQMKSEFVNRHKLSNDVFIDALATKSVTDELCIKSSSNIEGYIQEISLNPFGYLLFSDKQVLV